MSWWLIVYCKQIKWILIKYKDHSLYIKRIQWIWIRYLLYNTWIDMSIEWIKFTVLSNIYDRLNACEIDGPAV